MKKIAMFFTAALLLTTGLQAQQVINSCELKNGYLPYVWLENTESLNLIAGGTIEFEKITMLKAKYFYVDDAVPVYGIAAGLTTTDLDDPYPYIILDTSWNNAYEYFTLYKHDADTLGLTPVSDSLVFHLRDTPVSYYMNLICGSNHNYNGIEQEFIIPVYERYFDSVYWMTDSFYVGMTQRSYKDHVYDSTGTYYEYSSWPVIMLRFGQEPYLNQGDIMLIHRDLSDLPTEWQGYPIDWGPEWNYMIPSHNWDNGIYFIFPILTPPDTTGTGDDSLAVQQVQLVDRLVAVQPNPATERVKVVSSCGMERLTAYNAAGKQVYRQEASGLSTTLDVSRWPAGTYILHVQTPMGTTTKRLVVTR